MPWWPWWNGIVLGTTLCDEVGPWETGALGTKKNDAQTAGTEARRCAQDCGVLTSGRVALAT